MYGISWTVAEASSAPGLILALCSCLTLALSFLALSPDPCSCAQGQTSYAELKQQFQEAVKVEPSWEKPYFQYAR